MKRTERAVSKPKETQKISILQHIKLISVRTHKKIRKHQTVVSFVYVRILVLSL